jgi:hypothetical protein
MRLEPNQNQLLADAKRVLQYRTSQARGISFTPKQIDDDSLQNPGYS